MKVTNSLLLHIVEKTSISSAFVYLILSQRKKDDIYANSKTFEKYGVSRHVLYKALKELKEIGLIYFKYGVGNQREVILKKAGK